MAQISKGFTIVIIFLVLLTCNSWANTDPRDYNGSIFGIDYTIPAGESIDQVTASWDGLVSSFSVARTKFPFSLVDTLTGSLQVLLGQRSLVDPNISVQLPGVGASLSLDFSGMMCYISVFRILMGIIFTYYLSRYFAFRAWGLR